MVPARLRQAREVDSIRLKFEEGQPDRSMQFTLKVIDANGDEHTVAERTEADLSKQQGIVMDVPVGMSITRIRMDIADARIPSSGSPAWPLVSEIESTRRPATWLATPRRRPRTARRSRPPTSPS